MQPQTPPSGTARTAARFQRSGGKAGMADAGSDTDSGGSLGRRRDVLLPEVAVEGVAFGGDMRLYFQPDRLHRVLGLGGGVRQHQRHRRPREGHLGARQGGEAGGGQIGEEAVHRWLGGGWQISGGEHRHHTGHRPRRRRLEGEDPPRPHGSAQESGR